MAVVRKMVILTRNLVVNNEGRCFIKIETDFFYFGDIDFDELEYLPNYGNTILFSGMAISGLSVRSKLTAFETLRGTGKNALTDDAVLNGIDNILQSSDGISKTMAIIYKALNVDFSNTNHDGIVSEFLKVIESLPVIGTNLLKKIDEHEKKVKQLENEKDKITTEKTNLNSALEREVKTSHYLNTELAKTIVQLSECRSSKTILSKETPFLVPGSRTKDSLVIEFFNNNWYVSTGRKLSTKKNNEYQSEKSVSGVYCYGAKYMVEMPLQTLRGFTNTDQSQFRSGKFLQNRGGLIAAVSDEFMWLFDNAEDKMNFYATGKSGSGTQPCFSLGGESREVIKYTTKYFGDFMAISLAPTFKSVYSRLSISLIPAEERNKGEYYVPVSNFEPFCIYYNRLVAGNIKFDTDIKSNFTAAFGSANIVFDDEHPEVTLVMKIASTPCFVGSIDFACSGMIEVIRTLPMRREIHEAWARFVNLVDVTVCQLVNYKGEQFPNSVVQQENGKYEFSVLKGVSYTLLMPAKVSPGRANTYFEFSESGILNQIRSGKPVMVLTTHHVY